MVAGRLLPNLRGIPSAANKLVFFFGVKTLVNTVLSPNLPPVSNAMRVMSRNPFLNRNISPGSKIKLLTLLRPLLVVMTGDTSKLNPNLSEYNMLMPAANPMEKLPEKFQVVDVLLVDTMGRNKQVYVTILG